MLTEKYQEYEKKSSDDCETDELTMKPDELTLLENRFYLERVIEKIERGERKD